MKKLVLATAIAALSVSAAQAAPTVYGKAFLTLDVQDSDKNDSNRATLNSDSRIGVKGAEALTANTDVGYQLEYKINIDDANEDQFKSRDTYLGLSNKTYGTALAGRLSAIDDHINYVSRNVGQFDNGFGGAAWDGDRVNNAFAYISPNYNGFTGMAMYGLQERTAGDLATEAEGYGVGFKYEPAGQAFRGGATYIWSDEFKTARVSGAVDATPNLELAALYQLTDSGNSNAEKENVFSVSGELKTATPWAVYSQVDVIKNKAFVDGDDNLQATVGGKYRFNQAATGHLYAGYKKFDSDNSANDDKGFGAGAGLEYKF